jgi:hypothetical protein
MFHGGIVQIQNSSHPVLKAVQGCKHMHLRLWRILADSSCSNVPRFLYSRRLILLQRPSISLFSDRLPNSHPTIILATPLPWNLPTGDWRGCMAWSMTPSMARRPWDGLNNTVQYRTYMRRAVGRLDGNGEGCASKLSKVHGVTSTKTSTPSRWQTLYGTFETRDF